MESKRWKANNGEKFWYIDHFRNEAGNAIYWRPEDWPNVSWGWRWDGKPPKRTWMDDAYDFGNMFQTHEEAVQVLDKWNKVLKEHWDE